MTTITFDTLKFTQRLEQAGISHDHAVAMAEAQKESLAETIAIRELATKSDLEGLKSEMHVRFERIDGELKLNRWMLGVLLAGVVSLVLKAFF
jgi:hypothetical protein